LANLQATLFLRIRTADGKRRIASPVYTANHKLKRLFATVNGKAEYCPSGVYYLRFYDGDRQVWERVGKDADAAIAAQFRREQSLRAKAAGLQINEEQKEVRIPLEFAIENFLSDMKTQRSAQSAKHWAWLLARFRENCEKTYLDEIERRDIINFMQFFRNRGSAPRTVYNNIQSILTFFRRNGINGLLVPADMPKYVEKKVAAYNASELKALFAAADDEERLAYQFFLYSGGREREVAYSTWRDIDFQSKTFTITAKPDLGFTPKDFEERSVPLPDALVNALKERRRKNPDSRLIFTNKFGGVEGHFLHKLKRLTLCAGLNCGHCVNKKRLSCKKHPVCDNWELHKFRKSFATIHHESGVSARTLQAWLGHSDLETTISYLETADMRSDRMRAAVNNSFAVFSD
jgi:integrase/recombinase XerD